MEISKELIDLIRDEIVQRREEGCDVEAIKECVKHALRRSDGLRGVELYAILRDLESLQPAESFPYVEPSTLNEIRAERPHGPRRMELNLTDAQMLDRIHGAWLGRAAGCPQFSPILRVLPYLLHTHAHLGLILGVLPPLLHIRTHLGPILGIWSPLCFN